MMKVNLENYVPKPPNQETLEYRNGDTQDIMATIAKMDAFCAKSRLLRQFAPLLRGRTERQTLERIWNLAKNEFTYKADAPGKEKVKSSAWMLYYRVGDCKSFSITIADILRELGFQFVYRFVSFERYDKTPTHVYVVAYTSSGEEIFLDAVHTKFNEEPRHFHKIDVKPARKRIAV